MKQIREHEAQHVTLLSGGLTAAGATPVQACTYKFPYKGVKEFLALSQIIEGVGVAACESSDLAVGSLPRLNQLTSLLSSL